MPEHLGELLELQRKLDGPALAGYPDIQALRRSLLEKIGAAVTRMVPEQLQSLERAHGWSAFFHRALEAYDRAGLFGGKTGKGALLSGKELRNNAPGMGDVLDELKQRPELLIKVEQGFTKPFPVPFGLSPAALKDAIGDALRHYHAKGKLKSSGGCKQRLHVAEPVCMWGEYHKDGSLVYFPQRFDQNDHGGKTKQEVLASSKHPGWQVLLLEDLRDIPTQGRGKTVGGRKQIEAGRSAHDYLALRHAQGHDQEEGWTLEAWMSRFLTNLEGSGGEVLDDFTIGAACYCTAAYSPSFRIVPFAFWGPDRGQAFLSWYDPASRCEGDGARAAVRVL